MNPHDIDLDVERLLEQIPDDHVAFYMRADDSDEMDFVFASGNLGYMAEALAGIMEQSEDIAQMVNGAIALFYEK